MIDWVGLLANSTWIFASAMALAVASVAYWKAQYSNKKLGEHLKMPECAFPLNLSGFFFCVGMAALSNAWWEILIWVVIIVLFGYQSWIAYQDWSRKRKKGEDADEV